MTDCSFSKKPCKHKTNKVDGRWNLLKLNPKKKLLRLCHTCGHVQGLE